MAETAALIEYASDHADLPADRLLRRIVAWVAILYGGCTVINKALFIALAEGWVASPKSMSWQMDGGRDVIMFAVSSMITCAPLLGGILLLSRVRASILLLRIWAACSIVLSIFGVATSIAHNSIYASYWSTPATASVNALQSLRGLFPEILIGLLTLPSLARRMV